MIRIGLYLEYVKERNKKNVINIKRQDYGVNQ